MAYLLDSNNCIYALKNRPPEVLERLRSVSREAVAVSVTTVLELRHGAERSVDPTVAHQRLDRFFSPLHVVLFDEEAARVGARIRADLQRRGTPIGELDMLIAATALARDLTLVTNNLREFERVVVLRTENWVA